MSFALKNTSKYLGMKGGTGWWSWTAYIESLNGEDLNEIKYVEYKLHSSFENPIKKSRKFSEGFPITMKGWGTFELKARIVFKDSTIRPIQLSHDLRFEGGESQWENGR